MNKKRVKLFFVFVCVGYLTVSSVINVYGEERIYVATRLGSSVNIIDTAKYETVKTIQPKIASAKIIAANNAYLYLINMDTIYKFERSGLTLNDIIDFDGNPTPGMCKAVITPDGNKMYIGVVGWGKEETSGVFVIDLVKKKQLKIIEQDNISTGFINISQDGRYIYMPVQNTIKIINTANDETIKQIKINTNGYVSEVIANVNNLLYAAINEDKHSKIEIINTKNGNDVSIPLKTRKICRMIMISGDILFVLCEEGLVKINTVKKEIIKEIKIVGSNLAASKDGGKIFVTSSINNQLIIYDVNKEEVIKNLEMGDEPYDVLVQ